MKSRFSTIDITAVIRELLRFVSMRVMNVYDLDNKTYLIRLGKPDDKAVIVIESGIKIHSTEFDWPKNPAPSGFSVKMRKHLKGRRLESVKQLGVDRIVDLTFGSDEAAYHVILELYDRGNIVLTDYEYTILNILRPRTDNSQDVRFAVREKYPVEAAKQHEIPTIERLQEIILAGKEGDTLKKLLIPHLDYGPAMIEHCLQTAGFPENVKLGKGFHVSQDMQKLFIAIEEAEALFTLLQTSNTKGYIIQKVEKRPAAKPGESTELLTYDEYHPMLFKQHEKKPYIEFDTFNKSVDEFYSQMESQKLELKVLQQEKQALKKLDNIKKDHEKRVDELQKEQEIDRKKGELIEMNLDLVDRAILIVRSAIANQIDWTEIHNLVKEAQIDEDPVAMAIKELKLNTNHIVLLLQNPYVDSDFEDDGYDEIKPLKVEIDLALSAYANSRKYYEKKKSAAVKEQKTTDASAKALKSAEKKTKETLKEAATTASINKARKTYWFEKFLWFISSENFLVIGGRDQQQNELIVKRYMKQNDIYVHADLHGASSVIIKNHTGEPVPPKTLNEAGTMAICNSAAWDAKVVTSAWWVYASQVSKTAPSGEYLTTGSFMIRGKKNYLPPSYLVYGFGLVFKLEEGSVDRHLGERKVRTVDDDEVSIAGSLATESEITMETSNGSENDDIDSDDEAIQDTEDKDDQDNSEQNECSKSEADPTLSNQKEDITLTQVEEIETDSADSLHTSVSRSQVVDNSENIVELTDTNELIEESHYTNISNDSDLLSKKDMEGKTLITVQQQCAIVPKVEFPDTEIGLQHISGDKYGLSRLSSVQSEEDKEIYLGDDIPIVKGVKNNQSGARLSAKQRRDLKRAKKRQLLGLTDDDTDLGPYTEQTERGDVTGEEKLAKKEVKSESEGQTNPPQAPPKRGQKGKSKRIKEKYKDMDEEERQLCIDILASAGKKKEDKKKKGKKGEETKGGRPQSGKKQPQQQQQGQRKKMELVDIVIKEVGEMSTDDTKPKPVLEAEEEEKIEEDPQSVTDDLQTLNSLTGIPVSEDELLFAIPVCAPYNSLVNYKYKVKLLPGSTKRGKGAKLSLNMFMQDKTITSREKDLLKTLKDADMSRNIPGKVKVTAPNLTKVKKK